MLNFGFLSYFCLYLFTLCLLQLTRTRVIYIYFVEIDHSNEFTTLSSNFLERKNWEVKECHAYFEMVKDNHFWILYCFASQTFLTRKPEDKVIARLEWNRFFYSNYSETRDVLLYDSIIKMESLVRVYQRSRVNEFYL